MYELPTERKGEEDVRVEFFKQPVPGRRADRDGKRLNRSELRILAIVAQLFANSGHCGRTTGPQCLGASVPHLRRRVVERAFGYLRQFWRWRQPSQEGQSLFSNGRL